MARFSDPWQSRTKIDEFVDLWKQRGLLSDDSLLFEDRQLWTLPNVHDFRTRFLGHPLVGVDQNFGEKLSLQLADASEDLRWFVCELVAVYFLFAAGAVNGPGKMRVLGAIVEPVRGEVDPPGWERMAATMYEGIGNPGSGYNIRRDLQMGYLLDFVDRFKQLPDKDRQELLNDPWRMRGFADDVPEGVAVREMRHILLHLLQPDHFERISSGTHKQQIVDAFWDEFLEGNGPPEDLDEQLYVIRQQLEGLDAQPDVPGGVLDFYWPPLNALWDPGADASEGAGELDLLLYKKQIIFYGPPGTSKTHRTRELADTLIRREALRKWGAKRFFEQQEELVEIVEAKTHWVQLHPGYGYEEFIRGLRLTEAGTTYVPGLLPLLVGEIEKESPVDRLPTVLVLDEINRTDLSRMFGETFSALENRGEPAILPGLNPEDEAQTLTLPDDLYVIGTMNLIDQSVEELDFALRRRFFWSPSGFDPGPILAVNQERWAKYAPLRYGWDRAEADMTTLAERAELLNSQIEASTHLGPQYALGHTYYFDAAFFAGNWLKGRKQLTGGVLWTASGKPRPAIEDLWRFSLEPLLAQYLEGLDTDTAADELERLENVLLHGTVE